MLNSQVDLSLFKLISSLITGRAGLMSRFFGTTDRGEIKELKVNAAEQRIQEGKNNLQAIQIELK